MPSLPQFDLSGLAAFISAGLAILLWDNSRKTQQENKRIKNLEYEKNGRIEKRKALLMDIKHRFSERILGNQDNILASSGNAEAFKRALEMFDYAYEMEKAEIEADHQKKLAGKPPVAKKAEDPTTT